MADDSFRYRPAAGGTRALIEATLRADAAGGTLALVLATEGSTYVRPGALALFGGTGLQIGWLSGGCLEPEIARRAAAASADLALDWLEIDTRDDEDLFAGSATGCRGRLRIALLPLAALSGWGGLAHAWLSRRGPLRLALGGDGRVSTAVGGERRTWMLAAKPRPWTGTQADEASVEPPPSIAILGAGPETAVLLSLLQANGWMTQVVERRPRWLAEAAAADLLVRDTPAQACASVAADAVLVMHHNFELDREALEALGAHPVAFIGLLGPPQRREDLLRVLPAACVEALRPRLRSPVGLDLGGSGPEAIALSIAAQLQAWRHDR